MPLTLLPTTRRGFIAGSLGFVGGVQLAPRWVMASIDDTDKFDANRIALLADPHICADPTKIIDGTRWPGSPVNPDEHYGVNPADCLAHVVNDILAQKPLPAHAIVNGDCAYDTGIVEEYREFTRLIKPLLDAGIVVHITIGNHDNRDNLWKVIPDLKQEKIGRHLGVVELPQVNLLLLDSATGTLGKDQFKWIADSLGEFDDKPVLGFVHINPYLRPGTRPLDGLGEGESLLTLLAGRKSVKSLFFGHTHNWGVERWIDVHMVNQPCVGPYFGKDDPNGWVDMTLTDDGADIELRCINDQHPRHEERHHLTWRAV